MLWKLHRYKNFVYHWFPILVKVLWQDLPIFSNFWSIARIIVRSLDYSGFERAQAHERRSEMKPSWTTAEPPPGQRSSYWFAPAGTLQRESAERIVTPAAPLTATTGGKYTRLQEMTPWNPQPHLTQAKVFFFFFFIRHFHFRKSPTSLKQTGTNPRRPSFIFASVSSLPFPLPSAPSPPSASLTGGIPAPST